MKPPEDCGEIKDIHSRQQPTALAGIENITTDGDPVTQR